MIRKQKTIGCFKRFFKNVFLLNNSMYKNSHFGYNKTKILFWTLCLSNVRLPCTKCLHCILGSLKVWLGSFLFLSGALKQECFKQIHPEPFKPSNNKLWRRLRQYLVTSCETFVCRSHFIQARLLNVSISMFWTFFFVF